MTNKDGEIIYLCKLMSSVIIGLTIILLLGYFEGGKIYQEKEKYYQQIITQPINKDYIYISISDFAVNDAKDQAKKIENIANIYKKLNYTITVKDNAIILEKQNQKINERRAAPHS